jgi:hypothetical protein
LLPASPSGRKKVVWGDAMPMESWQASPVPLSQYMERSAMRGFVPCTWVEKSVFPIPATSFTLMVLRELAAREKGAWAFAPEDVM